VIINLRPSYTFQRTMGGVVSQTVGNSVDYYQSPPYTVMESKEGYELRRYEASMWTSARLEKQEGMPDEKMNSNLFWSLFNYISGKTNEERQKVSMTTPVLIKNEPEDTGMKMSFYLPKENQQAPPRPSETHVATDAWPVTDFYVRQFSPPNAKIEHFLTNKEDMVKAMERDGLKLKEKFEWMRAGYDAPFKIANRRSEVWIPVDQIISSEAAASSSAEAPKATPSE